MFRTNPKSAALARTISALVVAAMLIPLMAQPLWAAEDVYLPVVASVNNRPTGPGSDEVRGAGVFALDDGSQMPEIGTEPDPTGEEEQLGEGSAS